MTGPRYAELQVTSPFSFLRGASSAEELFATAAMMGIDALAVTDRNSLSGIVRAWEAAKATGVRWWWAADWTSPAAVSAADLSDGPGRLWPPLPLTNAWQVPRREGQVSSRVDGCRGAYRGAHRRAGADLADDT